MHRKLSAGSIDREGDPDLERGTVEGWEGEERDGGGSRPSQVMDGNTSAQILMTPQMRSMRLIGNSNPRYQW